MKKILMTLLACLFIFQSGFAVGAESETSSWFSSLKDAIFKDVQNTVNSASTKAINSVKLANCKAQLAQKQQELAELEDSNMNFFSKFLKRRRLKRQIRDLEADIKELEAQN